MNHKHMNHKHSRFIVSQLSTYEVGHYSVFRYELYSSTVMGHPHVYIARPLYTYRIPDFLPHALINDIKR